MPATSNFTTANPNDRLSDELAEQMLNRLYPDPLIEAAVFWYLREVKGMTHNEIAIFGDFYRMSFKDALEGG